MLNPDHERRCNLVSANYAADFNPAAMLIVYLPIYLVVNNQVVFVVIKTVAKTIQWNDKTYAAHLCYYMISYLWRV